MKLQYLIRCLKITFLSSFEMFTGKSRATRLVSEELKVWPFIFIGNEHSVFFSITNCFQVDHDLIHCNGNILWIRYSFALYTGTNKCCLCLYRDASYYISSQNKFSRDYILFAFPFQINTRFIWQDIFTPIGYYWDYIVLYWQITTDYVWSLCLRFLHMHPSWYVTISNKNRILLQHFKQ